MNFTLILYQNGSNRKVRLDRLETKSQAKFTRRLKQILDPTEVYLRVSYADKGWNDGYYMNVNDLMVAYLAFVEK